MIENYVKESMYRKIKGFYEIEDKNVVKGKDFVLITITEINKNSIESTTIEYDLSKFDSLVVSFHNQVLDDFDAEYDDELANVIEYIVNEIRHKYENKED